MQQGAHALRRLGLENSGVFSVAHRSFLPDGTAIGGYGRALHASTRDALGNGRGDAQRRNAHIRGRRCANRSSTRCGRARSRGAARCAPSTPTPTAAA